MMRLLGHSLGILVPASACLSGVGHFDYELTAALKVQFEPFADSGRVAEDETTTEHEYAIRLKNGNTFILSELGMHFDAITYRLSSESLLEAFDPSNPPPEYSLCHNGHCHHEDGRLVDYEDIVLEENASNDAETRVVSVSGTYQLDDEVLLEVGCEDDACSFNDTYPAVAELTLSSIIIAGREIVGATETPYLFELEALSVQGFVDDLSELEFGSYHVEHTLEIPVQVLDALVVDGVGDTPESLSTTLEGYFLHRISLYSSDHA